MANFDRANRDRENDDHGGREYDGGPDEDDNEGSHLPVVIIIAILVLAAFGGVVWLAYNQGVARGRNDVPTRVATTQGAKADDSGIKVYQQSAGPEEETDGKAAKAAAPVTPPPAAAEPAQQQVQSPPVQAAPVQQPAVQAQPVPKAVVPTPPPAPKPQQQVASAKPYALPASDEPAKPQVATKPPAQLIGPHAATVPAIAPPKTAVATKPEPLKPAALKPMAEAPAKAAASGSYLLQIGAYKSEADAHAAWKTYQSKHATLLNGFGPDVQRTTHDDGSIWYRLRIASFSDKDAATAVCDRLKAQGGACFLAK